MTSWAEAIPDSHESGLQSFWTVKRVTNEGSIESSWRRRSITAIAVSSPPTHF